MPNENSKTERTKLLPALIIISFVLLIGFGFSLIEVPPKEPGWWQRGLLSAGVWFVALAIVGIVCTIVGNRLRFSDRVNGAIVMVIGFVLLRLSFHLAGLSDEDIFRSLGSAVLLGVIVGAAVGPRLKKMSGRRRQKTGTTTSPLNHEDEST